ncbi:MAG TPA: hypothetical protein VIM98_01920 [Dyella sp.]|uniref:hypothetical protein n=1 Tax=Dyella sp. TaxID=1869338 RepID=UPI002F9383D2
MTQIDHRAKQILFDTFWNNGWIDNDYRRTPPEDFEYAKAQGLMFDPLAITHDALIERIVDLAQGMPPGKPARAFLCSLSTRRVDWRSGLASWSVARRLSKHIYQELRCLGGHSFKNGVTTPRWRYECGVCAGRDAYWQEDLNVLSFERVRWGGLRHGDLIYTLLDLEQLAKAEIPEPLPEDIDIFRDILKAATSLRPNDAPGALRERLKDVVPSSKDERSRLLEVLACAGVLEALATDRPRLGGTPDWKFISDWRGQDGFNAMVVEALFGAWL